MYIEKQLSVNAKQKEKFHVSLLTSHTGIALFFAYLFLFTKKEKYLSKTLSILSDSVEFLNKNQVDSSLANGFTGIAWAIQHVKRLNLLDNTSFEGLDELEAFIAQSIDIDIQNRNYDLFYGAIGKGLYFMEVPETTYSKSQLEKIVLGIESLAIADINGLSWNCYKRRPNGTIDHCIEIGMAHGMSSIISFLSRVHRLGIAKEKTEYLLKESLRWVITRKKSTHSFLFPVSIPEDTRKSWLAWCSGDLGVGLAIYHAACTLQNETLLTEAEQIVENACRIDFPESGIHTNQIYHDAGLCHGSLGLAYIFNKFYRINRNDKYKERSNYWSNCAFNLWLKNPNGLHDMRRFNGYRSDDKWINDFGLLEGLSGIGLMLLSLNGSDTNDWDRLFFIDI